MGSEKREPRVGLVVSLSRRSSSNHGHQAMRPGPPQAATHCHGIPSLPDPIPSSSTSGRTQRGPPLSRESARSPRGARRAPEEPAAAAGLLAPPTPSPPSQTPSPHHPHLGERNEDIRYRAPPPEVLQGRVELGVSFDACEPMSKPRYNLTPPGCCTLNRCMMSMCCTRGNHSRACTT